MACHFKWGLSCSSCSTHPPECGVAGIICRCICSWISLSFCFHQCQLQMQSHNNVFQHLDLFIPNCRIVWGQTRRKSWSSVRSMGCSYQPVPMMTMNQTKLTTISHYLTLEKIETWNKGIAHFLFHFSSKNFEELKKIFFNWS